MASSSLHTLLPERMSVSVSPAWFFEVKLDRGGFYYLGEKKML